jgi:hypothetical protein
MRQWVLCAASMCAGICLTGLSAAVSLFLVTMGHVQASECKAGRWSVQGCVNLATHRLVLTGLCWYS